MIRLTANPSFFSDRFELYLRTIKKNYGGIHVILDIGAGECLLEKRAINVKLVRNNTCWICSDSDKNLLNIWKEVKKIFPFDFNFVLCDATFLPFRLRSIDLVIATEIIEHLTNPLKFLKETHRVLRKRGMIILSTPNLIGLWTLFFDKLPELLKRLKVSRFRYSGRAYAGHVSLFTYHSLLSALRASGFLEIRDLKRNRAEGLMFTISMGNSLRARFGIDFSNKTFFKVLRKIEFMVSELVPKSLQSGWALMAMKHRD